MTTTKRLVLVLAVVGALLAAAEGAIAAPPGHDPTVSGTVYGSDRVPIPGATLEVAVASRAGVYGVVAHLTTDASGHWTFTRKAGDFRFVFAAPSADPATRYLTMIGRTVYSLDVTLASYGTISGTVRDSVTRLPVAVAALDMYRRNDDGTWPASPSVTFGTKTGSYTSPKLLAGAYRVRATAAGYDVGYYDNGTYGPSPSTVFVARGSALNGIDVLLMPLTKSVGITGPVVTNASR